MKAQWKTFSNMKILLVIILGLTWISPTMAKAEDSDLRSFGDIMQFALPAAGLVGTFIADDPEGRHQWAWTVGGTALTVQVWKQVASKSRPDAEGNESFPSGHTSGAFSGAAFIYDRYGPWWGVPAYACAIVTGYSRIDADAHFWDDVLAGASTAMMFSWYFTSPYSERVTLMPTEMGDGYGMKLTVKDSVGSSTEDKKSRRPQIIKYPTYTYIFKFGPAWQDKNIVRAPNEGGTEFDFDDYENIDDPITTSDVSLDIRLAERHKILFGFAPYENRDRTTSADEFTFGDQTFPSDVPIRTAYRLFELRGQYSYGLLLSEKFSTFIGAGIAWERVEIEIQQGEDLNNPVLYEEVEDNVVLPYLYLRGGYNFTDKIEGFLEVDGMALDQDKIFNLFAGANYYFNNHWYIGGGYVFSYRQIDTDDLYNEYQFQGIQAQVAYTF